MGVDDGRWRGSDDLDPAGRQRHVLGAGGSLRRTRIRAPGRTRRTPFRATSPLWGRTPNEGAVLLPVAVGYAPSSSRAGDRYGAPRRQPCPNRPRGGAGVSRVHEPAQRPSLRACRIPSPRRVQVAVRRPRDHDDVASRHAGWRRWRREPSLTGRTAQGASGSASGRWAEADRGAFGRRLRRSPGSFRGALGNEPQQLGAELSTLEIVSDTLEEPPPLVLDERLAAGHSVPAQELFVNFGQELVSHFSPLGESCPDIQGLGFGSPASFPLHDDNGRPGTFVRVALLFRCAAATPGREASDL